jgi:hypothetical protein
MVHTGYPGPSLDETLAVFSVTPLLVSADIRRDSSWALPAGKEKSRSDKNHSGLSLYC